MTPDSKSENTKIIHIFNFTDLEYISVIIQLFIECI
jgi:hypothetical protein